MPSKKSKTDLNELGYISWEEFKKMAPPIIKLEVSRISKMINIVQSEGDTYNTLIKVRYELNQFIDCLKQTNSPPLRDPCTAHLSKAILNLSFKDADSISKEVHYTLDRLKYVFERVGMIYQVNPRDVK